MVFYPQRPRHLFSFHEKIEPQTFYHKRSDVVKCVDLTPLFFLEAASEESASPLRDVVGSMILGSEGFVRAIRDKYLKGRKVDRDVPAVRELKAGTSAEEIAETVDRTFKEDPTLARKVKLYLYHTQTAQSLKQIGTRFGISESGVSQASRRMSVRLDRDSRLRKRISAIRDALALSNVYGVLPK